MEKILRSSVAAMPQKICDLLTSDKSLETLLTCRLISLDKCHGVRQQGVGEVLRRIISKTMFS